MVKDIGELDQLMNILQPNSTPDGYGGGDVNYQSIGGAWAKVTPIRSTEKGNDRGAVREVSLYSFEIYRRDDLDNNMVIEWDNKRFNIRNIKLPAETKQYMQVIAEHNVALD